MSDVRIDEELSPYIIYLWFC